MTLLPSQAYLFRKRWQRPRQALQPTIRAFYPKVSFHIPCYAEPPDIVCATLDALNQIRYPNYEVLLVDNNTADPALWHPLKHHCERLNANLPAQIFRFFHLDRLSGAKAGALNFALRQTDPTAELIAVVDADYQADPDFLARLVGFFDDPLVGYVQTPHDYRGWQSNFYQRACYWEYMQFFRLQLAGLNEWVASYIIGTMCLIRREALEAAGGWAEWCLTEDSEAAVRIHGLGYTSVFLTETFGRGLIPETFRGYKKQRLRWTIGPIQQLQRHWKLYLPAPFGLPSKLTGWQRVLELSHGLGGIYPLLFLAALPLGLATVGSILHHQEVIIMPRVTWMAIAMISLTALGNHWLTYRLLGCHSLSEMIASTLAALSLWHIRFVAAFKALFKRRSLTWRRTDKFKVWPNQIEALKSTQTECLLALTFAVAGFSLAAKACFSPPDLLLWIALGLISLGLVYLTAPLMSLLAEFELR